MPTTYTILIHYVSNDDLATELRAQTPVALHEGETFNVSDYSGVYTTSPFNHASYERNYLSRTITSFVVNQNVHVYFFYSTRLYHSINRYGVTNATDTIRDNYTTYDMWSTNCTKWRAGFVATLSSGEAASGYVYIGSSDSMYLDTATGEVISYDTYLAFTGRYESGYKLDDDKHIIVKFTDNLKLYKKTITVEVHVDRSTSDSVIDITADFAESNRFSLKHIEYLGSYKTTSVFFNTYNTNAIRIVTSMLSSLIDPSYGDGELYQSSTAGSWGKVYTPTITSLGRIVYQCNTSRYYEIRISGNSAAHTFSIFKAVLNDSSNYTNVGNVDRDHLVLGTIYQQTGPYANPTGPYDFDANTGAQYGDLVSMVPNSKLPFTTKGTAPTTSQTGYIYVYGGVYNTSDNTVWSTAKKGTLNVPSTSNYQARLAVKYNLVNVGRFDWDNPKGRGLPCNLTANEWNRLRTKAIAAFGPCSRWPSVSRGTVLTADLYNIAYTHIIYRGNGEHWHGDGFLDEYVKKGEVITADLLNLLRNSLNTAINA